MKHDDMRLTRRSFLSSAGLLVGFAAIPKGLVHAAASNVESALALNTFVHIGTDDIVTILSKHLEMGQGISTGLATLVAEELDADWSMIRVTHSPADNEVYANLAFGIQGTGASNSIANSYEQYRMAGATARAMLVAAAAVEWSVPVEQITVSRGRIRHEPSGREGGFGAFATRAATMRHQPTPTLKSADNFTLVGRELPRLDAYDKSTGRAVYTLDVMAKDMVVAMVAHPDHFGAKVKSFDDTEARKIRGVLDVRPVTQGVAVYGESTYTAMMGRDALRIEWDLSAAETRSSNEIIADYGRILDGPGGHIAVERGDVSLALDGDLVFQEAEMVFPFLAHAPMEPLDTTFVPREGHLDVYSGAQFPAFDQATVVEIMGVEPSTVTLHTMPSGGSFGRRAQFGSPYMREAAEVYKAFGPKRPLKHMWTREDDIRGGWYRPLFVHRLKGAMNRKGRIVLWDQAVAGQSIMGNDEFDFHSVEGAADLPYAVDNLKVVAHTPVLTVPPLWWRSVGHSHTAFAVETFVDEFFEAIGKDPVQGRLDIIAGDPRFSATLERAAELANWGSAIPEGRSRGVALVKSFGTYVAQIVEISRHASGVPKVHHVWCAVDCGLTVNPNHVRAQMEGGIGFGLSAALYGEISLGQGGAIVQSNFHDYQVLRINEMPHVDVAIVNSDAAPSGVGEPGTPPIAAAVGNAWRRLTGTAVRRLPFTATSGT